MKLRLALAVLIAAAWLAAPEAFAQGCSMCWNTAAAGGEQAARALDLGILVLLVPAISIFVGILVFAVRYRK
ncbi:hypothetical protein MYX77_08520 [Acidobacteriia bacterium AH_259_A11_L15]|nr:hypothetical protein [Acidobacteriia bacterium AH_259_A11_L15]